MKKYSQKTLPILLRDPKILLIGAGKVAHEKAIVLTKNKIDYSVIAKENISEIDKLTDSINIKSINPDDISKFDIIIDATGNADVATLLKEEKAKRNFLLNSVDVPEDCDFYFSALLVYGNLKIAVSTNGGSPTLARTVRNKIESIIPNTLGDLSNRKIEERVNGKINIESTRAEIKKHFGKVFLVGCGVGDPDLLTVKAMRIIKEAEIILYDNLITNEILFLVSEGVKKIFVGKEQGGPHTDQNQINALLEKYALEGLKVARLKSGDPYIFGRGSEEAQYLLERNIQVEVIPGISSAIGGPLLAGIPPTARGYAANLSIVSGCLMKDKTNYSWLTLLQMEYHTTIVLMGLNKVPRIVEKALEMEINPQLPVAIISNAGRPNQKVIITQLNKLVVDSLQAERPAILVFGDVVKLADSLPTYVNNVLEMESAYTK